MNVEGLTSHLYTCLHLPILTLTGLPASRRAEMARKNMHVKTDDSAAAGAGAGGPPGAKRPRYNAPGMGLTGGGAPPTASYLGSGPGAAGPLVPKVREGRREGRVAEHRADAFEGALRLSCYSLSTLSSILTPLILPPSFPCPPRAMSR
jgi:hypothetical protein